MIKGTRWFQRYQKLTTSAFSFSSGLPTIYHVGDDGDAAAVMVPISSTVIPLDDLPEYKVGIGFGLNEKSKVGGIE